MGEVQEPSKQIKDEKAPPQGMEMKRKIGLFSASNFIIGTIIGSGIFISPYSVLKYSGSVGLCLIIWAVAGVICLLGALAFAELGNVIPRSGAEYVFFIESFGPKHKFWGPLPAFIFSFILILVIRPSSVTILLLTSSEYIVQVALQFICFDEDFDTTWLKRLIALVELWLITGVNFRSVSLYLKLQNVFTVLKLLVCLVIIGGGLYEICIGNFTNLETGFEGTELSVGNIALALVSGLWAYDGWNTVTSATEEVKKPEVNVLLSILISIPLVTVFYLCTNVAYMTVLSVPEMTSGQAVAMTFGQKLLGDFAFIIPVGVTISTLGCAMALQFATTRICYVSGQYGHMLESLSYIHMDTRTPAPAVLLQGILATLVILLGEIVDLIEFASFLLWIAYGVCMISLLVLRKTKPDAKRPFKVPVVIPVFMTIVAAFLCVTSVITNPSPKYFIAIGAILLAFIIYSVFVYRNNSPKCLERFTYFMQVFLKVVPSDPKIV